MAIVKASYTRNRNGAKATIRYITHRPGRDGAKVTRTLFGTDGTVSRQEAYEAIDNAAKGSIFFRFAISPDPNQEDTRRDLHLREITETTMSTLEKRSERQVAWIAAIHADHAPHRHVHVLAVVQGRLNQSDLQALTLAATKACRQQRMERDQAREHEQQKQQREEEQWTRQH